MIYGSVCSGIEAASVAWHPLGWKAAWLSEIEKFPSDVLAHRWPGVPNLGDMTKLYENKTFQESQIDLLVGGTPCQSFSVAGLRKGLDDPRGNLCLEFLRLVDLKRPRWFVWENVPGVLSSGRGRDFGSFLGAVAKLGYGFAYRILDAQYFGVPQRRRRVFVVGHLGDWRPAAAVLFERESLLGHIKTSRKARKRTPASIERGFESSVQSVDFRNLQINEDGLSGTLQAKKTGGYSLNYTTGVLGFSGELTVDNDKIGPLDAGSRSGGGQPSMVLKTFDRQSTSEYGTDTVASTVSARDYKSASDLITIGFNWQENHSFRAEEEVTNPLRVQQTEAVMTTVSIHENQRAEVSLNSTTGALKVAGGKPGQGYPAVFTIKNLVRRLTPKECERLQGFPDDYTLLPLKKASDGPRYKALGNSMAVPVMRWIGQRIQLFEDVLGELFFG